MKAIPYYIVQVNNCYYQEKLDLHTFTDDEEQALAFTDIMAAQHMATEVDGTVLTREVSYEELEQLSAPQRLEYEALPSEERDSIESFCRTLHIGMYE